MQASACIVQHEMDEPQAVSLPTPPRDRYNGPMNAICLVFDRLHAGYVGAYGNSWIDTPWLDRLASQSLLLDCALVDSPDLEPLYRSYWQGWHALCPPPPEPRPSLAALLSEAGVTTALLTDEPQVARHPLAVDFDEIIEIDPPWQPQTAAAIDRTHFGRCFVEMIEWLRSARGPFLLWCHLGGLGTTWDAPPRSARPIATRAIRRRPRGPTCPSDSFPPIIDPDELLGITQAYSGQVTLLDTCLGALGDFLDALPGSDETLLTLASARGFPLGEHRRVGPCDGPLFGELVHVPWMIRLPDAAGAALRSRRLVEPADLWATLLDWWGVARPPPPALGRGPDVKASRPPAESLLPLVGGQPAPAAIDSVSPAPRASGPSARPPGISAPPWSPNCSPSPTTAGRSTMSPPAARTWSSNCWRRWRPTKRPFPPAESPTSRPLAMCC